MFNGIIYNKGIVDKIIKRSKGINLFIKSSLKINSKNLGVSVACDGVCLTLISCKKKISEFYLSNETLLRSKFKNIKVGNVLNLELPLIFGQKISGHICQGHVDTVAKVELIKKIDKSYLFRFRVDAKTAKQLIEKASICVNGISLTISKIEKKFFEIWVIPHTFSETNLSTLKKDDLVNLEIDILSKYVRNYFNAKK